MGRLLTALERMSALDPFADRLRGAVQGVLKSRTVRDALHGVWLGHPLHPAMVQAPLGAWLGTAVLDAIPGQETAATALLGAGNVAAVPTAIAGANDWASLSREQRRVGLAHAVANAVAAGLYWASLTARLRGRHATGRRLAYLGLAVASGSAYLGGHLSYAQAAAVNQAAPDLLVIPEGWHPIGELVEFPDGQTTVRRLGDVPVLVYRDGAEYTVLLERCAHQRGPLGEGKLIEEAGERCVVCPLHGSTYRLRDGVVVHGPAASDQPTLRTRVLAGRLEVSTD